MAKTAGTTKNKAVKKEAAKKPTKRAALSKASPAKGAPAKKKAPPVKAVAARSSATSSSGKPAVAKKTSVVRAASHGSPAKKVSPVKVAVVRSTLNGSPAKASAGRSPRPSIRVAPAGRAELTAKAFVEVLMTYQSNAELKKYERYFSFSDDKPLVGDQFVGVRMGHVFEVAKLFVDMPVKEIEKLMESPIHEVRAGAMSIMGKAASAKKVSPERLKELYDLYLRRHDRVNSWDLVDLAAHQVVGHYLNDKPREVLYKLAKSKSPYERRTAILATAHFIRQGEVGETFKIAALLMKDEDETVNKASGWMLRYAGKDRQQLKKFLDQYAATMPRSALRNALEHFDSKEKAHYMGLKKG
ncbi:DNA alkylation repair protein [Paraflavitalea sp. CAU 1676]|uniref:DNA alkylation repair protein n=1 Tax=Paraflavitalea sp. CAU 1676 TaxID=3032598 RepID=UPI0023DC92CD|nr:DNA alkylation repair protein [Paraflavitalea sp. CAU 1676]MDF2188160.1 DNA alkylation repair protein [Paraflavitalea sp. CAU 1676]